MTSNDRPDPREMWRFIGDATRPWAGWILTALGVVALVLGYLGVSRQALVAKQLPFLISGGMVGLALVFLGGVFLGTQDVREQGQRLESLEELVADLHEVLLAVGEEPGGAHRDNGHAERSVLTLPTGATYHTDGCAVLEDSGGRASRVPEPLAREQGLTPCKRCDPDAVTTSSPTAG